VCGVRRAGGGSRLLCINIYQSTYHTRRTCNTLSPLNYGYPFYIATLVLGGS
jgi:hypothetical protein